jgi:ribosome-binding factor A
MRHVPTLEFIHDALPDTARHLEEVLARARESDAAVAAAAAGATYAGEPDPYRKPIEADDLDASDDADEPDDTDAPDTSA